MAGCGVASSAAGQRDGGPGFSIITHTSFSVSASSNFVSHRTVIFWSSDGLDYPQSGQHSCRICNGPTREQQLAVPAVSQTSPRNYAAAAHMRMAINRSHYTGLSVKQWPQLPGWHAQLQDAVVHASPATAARVGGLSEWPAPPLPTRGHSDSTSSASGRQPNCWPMR